MEDGSIQQVGSSLLLLEDIKIKQVGSSLLLLEEMIIYRLAGQVLLLVERILWFLVLIMILLILELLVDLQAQVLKMLLLPGINRLSPLLTEQRLAIRPRQIKLVRLLSVMTAGMFLAIL